MKGVGGGGAFTYDLATDFVKTSSSLAAVNNTTLGNLAGASTPWCMSAWVKWDSLTTAGGILTKRDSGFLGVGVVYLTGYGYPVIRMQMVNVYNAYKDFNITGIVAGTWHHIVVGKGASANGTDFFCYVDGVAQTTSPNGGGTITGGFLSTAALSAGVDTTPGSTVGHFDGVMQNVAYFDTDQSGNVATLYNSGVPSDISSLSPAGWWRLGNGGDNATTSGGFLDSSGNGAHMTGTNVTIISDGP